LAKNTIDGKGDKMNYLRRWKLAGLILAILPAFLLTSCGDKRKGSDSAGLALESDSIHVIMSNVAENYATIYKNLGQEANFSDDKQKLISQHIENLRKLFQRADQIFEQKSDVYQIGYAFVIRYLNLTAELLKQNDQEALWTHLLALREICSTCHTQDNHSRSLYQGAQSADFESLFAYAEFNFSTRNYPEAVKFYQLDLERKKSATELDIILPIQRILSVYLQVYNDPEKALQVVRKYEQLKSHTQLTRAEFKGWISGLTYLKSLNKSVTKPVDMPQLTKWVGEFFGAVANIELLAQSNATQEVQRVWLRGRLYEYMNSNPPRGQLPEILYWLSIIDRSTSYNYYFSYSDLYLSQCVRKYSDLPYAKICYGEYEKYIFDTYLKDARQRDPLARYPDDIETEYRQLRELMEKNSISENQEKSN